MRIPSDANFNEFFNDLMDGEPRATQIQTTIGVFNAAMTLLLNISLKNFHVAMQEHCISIFDVENLAAEKRIYLMHVLELLKLLTFDEAVSFRKILVDIVRNPVSDEERADLAASLYASLDLREDASDAFRRRVQDLMFGDENFVDDNDDENDPTDEEIYSAVSIAQKKQQDKLKGNTTENVKSLILAMAEKGIPSEPFPDLDVTDLTPSQIELKLRHAKMMVSGMQREQSRTPEEPEQPDPFA